MYQNIDIFQQGGAADKDLLDRVVEGYEENVPLPAQILAWFYATRNGSRFSGWW